jgi:acyl-coenzyme A synthetase/AMP-(fatty) acid ligase
VVPVTRSAAQGGECELVAFVVGAADANAASATTLRRSLGSSLPKYMLPAEIRWIDALPSTSSGKVDRQKLIGLAQSSPVASTGESNV